MIHRILSLLYFSFLSAMMISLLGCDKENKETPPELPELPEAIGKVSVWLTTGDQTKLLSEEADIPITTLSDTKFPAITIDPSQKLQEIEGFGAALTGSSAYLIHKKMTSAQRDTLLQNLFDPAVGIGITYLRITMGASDFSLSDYTYDDIPPGETDFELSQFSIEKDKEDIIPVLQSIREIFPSIKVMGTPWSPPAWMKTNESLEGGKLKQEAYDSYTLYFVKFIQSYGDEGIPIDAITPQNEPLHFTASYPCLDMTAPEQLDFIKYHLGPTFQKEAITTKIIVYDHNWDHPEYAIAILDDPGAKQFVAGSAFHAYGGEVAAMSTVHAAHPDKSLYFTEVSGGEWATNFSDNLQWNMTHIFIGTTKNWSQTALLWNLALDENHGPKNGGCQDCRGVVTIQQNGSVVRNVEYYAIGHFSKFIRPGAHRITSTAFSSDTQLDNVAFINTDGSKVVVVTNNDTLPKSFVVKSEGKQFSYYIQPKSVVTLAWR